MRTRFVRAEKSVVLIEGFDAPTQIAVQADSSEHIQEAGVMAADLLNQGLSEAELEKAEYSVMDLQEIAQEVESFNQSFALLLGGIASISLWWAVSAS